MSAGAGTGGRASRVGAIDFVRGALMVAIVTSHSLVNLEPGHRRLLQITRYLLSGTVGFRPAFSRPSVTRLIPSI